MRLLCGLLVFVFGVLNLSEIQGKTTDQVEKAQRLMAQRPRPDAEIEKILTQCEQSGNKDYRVSMMQGLLARDQKQLAEAVLCFEAAHERAPSLEAPLFELAVTQEWRGEFQEARALYSQLLQKKPGSRAALLGLARVDRAQYRFRSAEGIYHDLLQKDPHDLEAQAGLAWIALANKRVGKARAGFMSILSEKPSDEEARIGLEQAQSVWRYRLDAVGGYTHNSNGSSASGGFDLKVALDAFNTVQLGNIYNSNELPSQQLAQQVFLPTTDTRIGYYYEVPQGVNAALTYDYRKYETLDDEHWIEASGGTFVTRDIQWVSGARVAFGAPQWNNVLFRTALISRITDSLRAGVTGYYDYQDNARLPGNIQIRDSYAFALDLYYNSPSRFLFNLGMGYNPVVDNVNFHAKAELPFTVRQSVLASFEFDSISDQYISNLGLRFYW